MPERGWSRKANHRLGRPTPIEWNRSAVLIPRRSGSPVVQTIAEQLRPLLVAWLLLALPVVCHNQTALVVLGALTAGHSHPHRAVAPTAEHPGHPTGAQTAGAGIAHGAHQHQQRAATPEWCTDHSGMHSHGLPEGQDSVGFVAVPAMAALSLPSVTFAGSQSRPPGSPPAGPLVPPPRPLV
jgi:hypothetical protein